MPWFDAGRTRVRSTLLAAVLAAAASISLLWVPTARAAPATVTGGETQLRIHF